MAEPLKIMSSEVVLKALLREMTKVLDLPPAVRTGP